MNRHIINRLEFEISCNDEIQALNLRHNFTATIQETLEAALENVFSKYADADTILHLDKLDLDLGSMSALGFQTGLQQMLEYKLEEALRGKLPAAASIANEDALRQAGAPLSILRFFLLKGRLPWYAGQTVQDLNQLAMEVWKTAATGLANWLLSADTPIVVWQRIAWQFSQEVQAEFVQQLPPLQTMTSLITARLHNNFNLLGNKYPISVWQEITDWLNGPSLPLLKPVLLHAVDIIAGKNNREFWAILMKELQQSTIFPILTDATITAAAVLNDLLAQENGATVTPEKDNMVENRMTPAFNEETKVEKIAVTTAGLVLIAPFLQRFFMELSLWKEDVNDWGSMDNRVKAICLLHYLATGEVAAVEYQLVLEKIICGYPLEMPLPPAPVLMDSELAEADSLLTAVIGHWSAVKNTSIPGLRHSFLIRDGLISKTEQGWKLQVERKTLDVLVDAVPWGFSTLHFPWSQELILVEW
ncbi:hypothetical protein CLV59_105244 [Chitinophaga dinghuensis]|uniref:Uncharacterized protein n=1 Tax=Chitinophaga dinghuensis TaxID=1539050 RepID=A0A327VYW1_9BACT|nr:contractile injection system tape measure protein [Chitinophaga dinghuensis]RAJ80136.1 hypothetical protein CLV59_105244 [Chitinophaga dinghuensis]